MQALPTAPGEAAFASRGPRLYHSHLRLCRRRLKEPGASCKSNPWAQCLTNGVREDRIAISFRQHRISPKRTSGQRGDAYRGGIEVPNVGCASSHGFPSTSAICVLQTRFTTNGHLATYFASRGQRCASQFLLSASDSNSGPRLFVSIADLLWVRRIRAGVYHLSRLDNADSAAVPLESKNAGSVMAR
jgi:hypothetical protein